MWWKLTIAITIMMMVFFIIGLYAGGATYLAMIGGDFRQVTIMTLFNAGEIHLMDRNRLYLPWAWCVTAALTFLPVGMTLLALFLGTNKKSSLHGDARFANNSELRAFKYRGNYQ
ncbi:hypothetical protein [Yersinia ruckeri]|uniref:hypothetical protein n=1 Tax=Yersinia ruckeri TaxID=29486 RepID=UPI002237C0E9|nr:hypothetical protein [Yersinia ruckeri]MCW6572916.1 hypothetical protein [Yersinia ruckeri]HDL7537457.1 hypothetical protein [Yersinia enterocolitica]